MKPLFVEAAEERLKGQPARHAKVYKDDLSIFEADMLYVQNHLLLHGGRSLGEIARETGIPKSTIQKLLSPLGIRRTFNRDQLAKMKRKNRRRYLKVITEYSRVLRDETGRWKGLEYRESDRERFQEWLKERGYMLLHYRENGKGLRFLVTKQPEDVREEIFTSYTHRIMRGRSS
jgi:hypothetical protein